MRIAVPGVAAAIAATGISIAAWPDRNPEPLTAVPVTSTPTPDLSVRDDPATRNLTRPSLTPSSSPSLSTSPSAATKEPEAEKKPETKKTTEKKTEEPEPEKSETKTTEPEEPATEPKDSGDSLEREVISNPDVTGTRYTTTGINVRIGPGTDFDSVTTLSTGDKVSITATTEDGWRQISLDSKARWVKSEFLAKEKPEESSTTTTSDGGISTAPCESSAVEQGLTSDAIQVHRALCARFPQISSFGGLRGGGGYHSSGQAVDAMISNSEVGWEIANWVRNNRQALGVSEVIYSQQIWTVQRAGEGWRPMEDRGSVSANHYDHIHISVYGNSAG